MKLINSAGKVTSESITFNDLIFGHAEMTNGWISGFVVGYAHDKSVLGLNGKAYMTENNLIGYLVHAWPAIHGPDGKPLMFVVKKQNVKAAYRLGGPLEQMIERPEESAPLVGLPFLRLPPAKEKEKEVAQ